MQVSLLVTIIIALVAILIGWGIGFADSNRNSSKKVRAAETRAEIAVKESEDKLAEAESRVAAAAAIQSRDDPGLLRVKDENGRVSLEMDGARMDTFSLNPDQKKRLISILTMIRPWLEGQPAQGAAPQPTARVSPSGTVSPPPTAAPVAPASPPSEPKAEKPAGSALSIVDQINSILQLKLVNTPLARQGIRLQQSPEGGVEVMVGGQRFGTVEDVPDPQVKSTIRAAIAEWEEKYTPGL